MSSQPRRRPWSPLDGEPQKSSRKRDLTTPVLWSRLQDEVAQRIAGDRLLATQVGRLSLLGLLSSIEVASAFQVAEIYGRYEYHHEKRRHAASPSYDHGYSSAAGTHRDAAGSVRAARRAAKQYARVQNCIPMFPTALGEALEALCCDNSAIPEAWLPELRIILRRIAGEFHIGPHVRPIAPPERPRLPPPSPTPTTTSSPSPTPTFAVDQERQFLVGLLVREIPELPGHIAERIWCCFQSLRAPSMRARAFKPIPDRFVYREG